MASGGKRRRAVAAVIVAAAVVLVGGGVAAFALLRPPAEPQPRAGGAPIAHPLSPAQQLVADADDPRACAVTFHGDGAPAEPMLQHQGELYQHLPIPQREGGVFAGWYASMEDAAGFAVSGRVNGAEPVVCVDQEVELFAAWKTPAENTAEGTRVPILMYHQFTAKPEGESGWLRGNYAYIGDFEAHMAHIADTGFYLPTWDELSAFIDGRLFLPARSVIVTDDDADQSWFDLAVPVVDEHRVLATSFMITAYRQDPAPSVFVLRRSHTHDLHQAGADGRGRMVNDTPEQIAADLDASAGVLGVREVVAYPFGHYDDRTKQGVALAGFELGRTIDPGYVEIGTDKLALPVVRIDYGMGLDALVARIG